MWFGSFFLCERTPRVKLSHVHVFLCNYCQTLSSRVYPYSLILEHLQSFLVSICFSWKSLFLGKFLLPAHVRKKMKWNMKELDNSKVSKRGLQNSNVIRNLMELPTMIFSPKDACERYCGNSFVNDVTFFILFILLMWWPPTSKFSL